MGERTARKRKAAKIVESPAPSPSPHRVWWLALALTVLTIGVYSGVAHHDFIDLDDAVYIYQNPHVTGGFSWNSVRWAFTTVYQANWHPLTWLSHMLDVQLFGLNAGGHHTVSVLWHLLSTLLLFYALHRMTGALGRSVFAAALFAVHPLHVESVVWAAERKDVLSTFFWMSAICAYSWYAKRPRLWRYFAVAGLFALGLMAKPMLVSLPFTLLLLDYWPLGRFIAGGGIRIAAPKLILEKLPLIGLSAGASVITFLAQNSTGTVSSFEVLDPLTRIEHAVVTYAVYLGKSVWPADLAPFYHYNRSMPLWMLLGSAALLATLSRIVFYGSRSRPYLATGWLWFLVTLAPVIGLVQVGTQAWADRYMYVPLIGLAIIVSWGGFDLLTNCGFASAAPVAATSSILALAVVARVQCDYWQDAYSVWSHAIEVTSDNQIAENGVGAALYLQGRIVEAVPHLTEAIRIQPNYVEARLTLALALIRLGRIDDGIAQEREAIRFRPDFALAHANLGLVLLRAKQNDEAAREFHLALQLDPENRDARGGLNYLAGLPK